MATSDQASKAITQVSQLTQQNAANSEELSSAAAELSGQSVELLFLVGPFQREEIAVAAHGGNGQASPMARQAQSRKRLAARKS